MDRKLEVILAAKDQASRVVNQSAQSMGKSMDTLNHRIKSVVSSVSLLAGAYGLARLSKSFLEAATVTENYQVRLKVLLGSVEEGNRLFKAMNDYAGKVPFTFQEIMGSATQLAGVMAGGVDEVKKWMPLIGDLAAATGLGIQQTTEQVIRMYSAGAASADLFRERGITAMLGFQAGVHYSAEETRKQLIRAWEDPASKFRNATDELAKTWTGLLSMMSDKWFKFRTDLMDAGTFEALKADLGEINNLMSTWAGWVGEILKAYHDIVLDTDKIGIRLNEKRIEDLKRQLDMAERIEELARKGNKSFGDVTTLHNRTEALKTQIALITKSTDKWRLEKNTQEKGLETTKKQATALKDVSVNMDLVMVQAGLLQDDYRDIIANTEAWESSLADVAYLASYALSDAFQEIDDSALYTTEQLKKMPKEFAGLWDEYTKDARAANKRANADFQHMMDNIQDIGANAFEQIMNGSIDTWKDMWDFMKSYAIKIIAQIASQQIIVPIAAQILGGGVGGGSGVGGSLGQSVGSSIFNKIPGVSNFLGSQAPSWLGGTDMGEYGLGFGSGTTWGSLAGVVGAGLGLYSMIDSWAQSHRAKPRQYLDIINTPEWNRMLAQDQPQTFDTIRGPATVTPFGYADWPAAGVNSKVLGDVTLASAATYGRDRLSPAFVEHYKNVIEELDKMITTNIDQAAIDAARTRSVKDLIKWRTGNTDELKRAVENWFGNTYLPYFNAINETAGDLWSEVVATNDTIEEDIQQMAPIVQMAKKIPEFWEKIGEIADETGTTLLDATSKLKETYDFGVQLVVQPIQQAITNAIDGEDWSVVGDSLVKNIKLTIASAIGQSTATNLAGTMIGSLFDQFGGLQTLIGNITSGDFSVEEIAPVIDSFKEKIPDMVDAMRPAIDALDELINSLFDTADATQQLTDRVDGFKDPETTFPREKISAWKAAYWNTLLGGGTDQQAMVAQLGVKYDWAKSGYSFSDVQNAIGNLNANDILDIAASFGLTFDEVADDIRSVMDTMTDLGTAAVDTASRMQDAATEIINQETSIADAWQGVRSGTQSRLSSMLYGSANPESAVNRLRSLRQAIGSMGYDTPELASQYSSTLGQYLNLAQEAYQRPSNAYQERYGFVLSQLQGLDTFASARQDRALEIAQEQRDLLAKISDNTEGGGTVTIYADTMSPEELRDRVVAILQSDTGRVVIQNTAQGKV